MTDVRAGVGARLVESQPCDVAVVIGTELHTKFRSSCVATIRHGGQGSCWPDGVTRRAAAHAGEIHAAVAAAADNHILAGRSKDIANIDYRHHVGSVEQSDKAEVARAVRSGYSGRRP